MRWALRLAATGVGASADAGEWRRRRRRVLAELFSIHALDFDESHVIHNVQSEAKCIDAQILFYC